jgi:hypothetical protein
MTTEEGGPDFDCRMETTNSSSGKFRDGGDEVNVHIFEEGHTWSYVSTASCSNYDQAESAQAYAVQQVDQETNLPAVSSDPPHHLHIAVSTFFSGRKEDFKQFRRQIGLFITVNKRDFLTDKSMVLFALSYMMEGSAELWANAFVDEALETGNWGL